MMIKRILILAGGTGGHVFPALAVAHHLREKSIDVIWLGTAKGIESSLVSHENIPFYALSISGFRGKNIFRKLLTVGQCIIGLFKAIKIIYHIHPDVVLAMGGYASGAGGMAAWLLRKRLILHEQNSVVGVTNKLLSYFATKILVGFPNVKGLRGQKVVYVGNPVRADIINLPAPSERFQSREGEKTHLLILGGSQGAQIFNETIPPVLSQLPEEKRPEVWHIAGKKSLEQTQALYQLLNVQAKVNAFVDQIVDAYRWADWVICRAGALTVSEISSAGLAALFVPFPYAVDDHQTLNAKFLSDHHAALLLSQEDFTKETLMPLFSEWLLDKKRLLQLAQAAWHLRKADALAQMTKELCGE